MIWGVSTILSPSFCTSHDKELVGDHVLLPYLRRAGNGGAWIGSAYMRWFVLLDICLFIRQVQKPDFLARGL